MMGLFGSAHLWRGKKAPLLKIYQTNPTTIKLGTVTTYLKKIHKKYKSSDTLPNISIFSTETSNFVISRNADKDCILIYNF